MGNPPIPGDDAQKKAGLPLRWQPGLLNHSRTVAFRPRLAAGVAFSPAMRPASIRLRSSRPGLSARCIRPSVLALPEGH